MTTNQTLIQIAKLAIEPIALELAPPATEANPPARVRKVKRKYRKRRTSAESTGQSAKKRTSRPKGALDYICLACKHGFRAVKPEVCPNCEAEASFVLKKDYNRDELPE